MAYKKYKKYIPDNPKPGQVWQNAGGRLFLLVRNDPRGSRECWEDNRGLAWIELNADFTLASTEVRQIKNINAPDWYGSYCEYRRRYVGNYRRLLGKHRCRAL